MEPSSKDKSLLPPQIMQLWPTEPISTPCPSQWKHSDVIGTVKACASLPATFCVLSLHQTPCSLDTEARGSLATTWWCKMNGKSWPKCLRAHAWVLLSWSLESDSWTLCRPQSSSSVPNPKSLPPLKKNRLKVVVYTIQDLCKSKILKLFLNCTMLKTAYKRVKHTTAR